MTRADGAGGSDTEGWRVLVASGCELAERPVWDERSGSLVWVDCLAGDLHRCAPSSAEAGDWVDDQVPLGGPVGAAGLREDGGLVAAAGSAFLLLDRGGRPDADPIPVDLPAGHRFNDGACDGAGRFLVGTTSRTEPDQAGVLLALDPDGAVRVLLDGVTESNGLAWSLDGGTLFYVDSGEPTVRRYGYDRATGVVGPRGPDLVCLADGSGVPDGLVVDSAGAVWVALWGGAAVHRYGPDGTLLATYPLPVDQPTCPVLAGPGLDLLVVSTAWEGLAADRRDAQPWAGHLLARPVPVRGTVAARYAGGAG